MMQLYTGRVVDPCNVQMSDIDIRDIAHNLSNICRFGGNTRKFYSVAQHSVLCSYEGTICPSLGCPMSSTSSVVGEIAHAQHKLLHDASEAYLGDIPRPLKYSDEFKGYRHIEDALQGRIYIRFGLDPGKHPCVAEADNRLLVREGIELMNQRYDAGSPSRQNIDPWSPKEAERWFLFRFRELFLE